MKQSCDKKEIETNREESEDKILSEAIRDKITKVREHYNANITAQRSNKVDIIKK